MSELKQPSSSYLPQAEEKSADGEIFSVVWKEMQSEKDSAGKMEDITRLNAQKEFNIFK